MGLDLYLEARITEKATGRCISACDPSYTESPLPDPDDLDPLAGQYFCVLWLGTADAYAVRRSWVEIINRNLKRDVREDEPDIPLLQSALREMCSCLYSYGMSPESSRFCDDIKSSYWDADVRAQESDLPYSEPDGTRHKAWNGRKAMETAFVIAADAMRSFIYMLEQMHYENRYQPLKAVDGDGVRKDGTCLLPDDFIPAEADKRKFRENPRDYAWSFRLFNSY
ncbi:MAG: hypothetical protein IKG82_03535 [Oscillospiraceae bacterium]|nr:hypothetical protein [Oscillospiraceae bacterium]